MDKALQKHIKIKALAKRHRIYSEALSEYKRYSWVPAPFRPRRMKGGLCLYFKEVLDLSYLSDSKEFLDKEPTYARHNLFPEWGPVPSYQFFWFKPGDLEPRIKILEEAVRLVEHQLNQLDVPLNLIHTY